MMMPYQTEADLPQNVRENLPRHAQEIYRKAFNSAWKQYADPKKRRGQDSREETSHKVAWGAVERVYAKDHDGRWRRLGH